VRIPTRFAINLAVAGALVMYDRWVALGRFPPRFIASGGTAEAKPRAPHGRPRFRRGAPQMLAGEET
jgi:hypothetical protein